MAWPNMALDIQLNEAAAGHCELCHFSVNNNRCLVILFLEFVMNNYKTQLNKNKNMSLSCVLSIANSLLTAKHNNNNKMMTICSLLSIHFCPLVST